MMGVRKSLHYTTNISKFYEGRDFSLLSVVVLNTSKFIGGTGSDFGVWF